MGNYKLEYTGEEIDKILDKANSDTPIYFVDSNTSDQNALLEALKPAITKMYQDYKNGKSPLLNVRTKVKQSQIRYDGLYYIVTCDDTALDLYAIRQGNQTTVEDSATKTASQWGSYTAYLTNGEVSSVLLMAAEQAASLKVLETTKDYTVPYEPLYDGSPATKKYVDTSIAAIASAGGGSGKIVAGELPRNSSATSSVDLGADVKAVIVSCNRFLELEKTETIANVTQLIMTPILLPGQTEQYLWYQSGSTDDLRWQKATLSAAGVLSIPAKCYGITYIAFY